MNRQQVHASLKKNAWRRSPRRPGWSRVWVRVPGGYRCEIERPGEPPMICILTGQGMRRWIRNADGRLHGLLLSGVEPTMEYWKDHIEHFGPRHVLRLVEPKAQVTLLSTEQDIGGARIPLHIVSNRGGERTFFLDAASHRLVKERRGDLELLYQEYKVHSGIRFARRVEDSAGRHQWSARTEAIEIGFPEALDDVLFQQP